MLDCLYGEPLYVDLGVLLPSLLHLLPPGGQPALHRPENSHLALQDGGAGGGAAVQRSSNVGVRGEVIIVPIALPADGRLSGGSLWLTAGSDRQPNARHNPNPRLQTGVHIGTLKNMGIQLEGVEIK